MTGCGNMIVLEDILCIALHFARGNVAITAGFKWSDSK